MKELHNFFILLILSIFIIENVVADDCVYLEEGLKLMSEEFIKDLKNNNITNCCDYKPTITCNSINNQNFITEIKISNVDVKLNAEVINQFSNLQHLNNFEIRHTNTIIEVPENFDKLKNLENLALEDVTKDTSCPEIICKLTNLVTLDLSDNKFKGKIPKCLGDLTNLKDLDLGGNSFEGFIPFEFTKLKNLKKCYLTNNPLEGYIPIFPDIRSCNYDGTNLCDLPNSLCKKSSLISQCTDQDIRKTNYENGSTDENYGFDIEPTENNNEVDNPNDNPDDNPVGSIMMRLAVGFIFMCIVFFIFCIISSNSPDNKKKLNNNNKNNNSNNNNHVINDDEVPIMSTQTTTSNETTAESSNTTTIQNNYQVPMTSLPIQYTTIPGIYQMPLAPMQTQYITQVPSSLPQITPNYVTNINNNQSNQSGLISQSQFSTNIANNSERPPEYSEIINTSINNTVQPSTAVLSMNITTTSNNNNNNSHSSSNNESNITSSNIESNATSSNIESNTDINDKSVIENTVNNQEIPLSTPIRMPIVINNGISKKTTENI
ncbi:L domain-like protein [Anaeromyces robustus]|uniref:L domain-like protein n=1 Tax=Anaeromyces robustus TaxID=1754192 RepID=A0A1Y1XC94_9FUNG|nr:L domain-like protein [Anaeromyces robustus]|eukprot:ORX83369.1 L domain-like protein [Anaeromyces robustus]